MVETSTESSSSAGIPTTAQCQGYWNDARVLVVTGTMAADFLQGYLTCDTMKLQPDVAQPTAICNVKGRVLANGWAIALPDAIGILVHHSLFDAAANFLTPYVNFSKCTLRSEPMFVAVNSAAATITLLDEVKVSLENEAPTHLDDVSAAMQRSLVASQHAFVSAAVSEEFLPQMLGLDSIGAVDFNKGCYLGQEIVARAQFRGEIKRRLQTFTWSGAPPAVGTTTEDRAVIVNVADDGQGLQVGRGSSAG